jgi:spermidine synthase
MLEASGSTADTDEYLVDTADVPGGACLQLVRHGRDFEILFGGEQLMGSWQSNSEKALATLVCQRLVHPDSRLLIGGLGMGFTLGAALEALPEGAEVTVAELVPKIVSWAHGSLKHLFGESLSDPRVSIEICDVHDLIARQPERFDAILLDVDNGPEGLINVGNERIYCNWGLRSAYDALRPGGILAVWSSYADDEFRDRLRGIGFVVEEVKITPDVDRSDSDHIIWLAAKAG